MISVIVRLTVKDQATWKKTFEEAGEFRKKFGSKGVHAFAKTDSPNEITILGHYESVEKAREMFQSDGFREVTQRAGIVGAPEVTFVNEVVHLPA
jgi:hypothetical protein